MDHPDRTVAADAPEPSLLPTVAGSPLSAPLEPGTPPSARSADAPVVLPAEVYAVGAEIARGGMGSVLKAEDRKLGRIVAMKVMRLESGASKSHRARFAREAAVLARLEHPNIVPIHELGFDAQNRLYYTMKLVQGRTLQAILNGLRQGDPDFIRHYTLDRLLTIFRKVCDAMSLAHARGVIHRDLKPDNIMVGEFGEVLVVDWGLAKIMGDSQQAAEEVGITEPGDSPRPVQHLSASGLQQTVGLTLDGDTMGTPLYMSPEQARGHSAEVDQQSDIFSLGGILYALLTLHPPVDGTTADEAMDRIKRGQILPPTAYNAPSKPEGRVAGSPGGTAIDPKKFQPLPHIPGHQVPAALSAVTMRALALDKSKRYTSVAELAADIESFQGGFATRAQNAGLFTQLRLLVHRHRREFAIGFAAWLLITALAVWFVLNLRASERETRRQAEIAQLNEKKAANEAERASKAEVVAVQEKETARQALAKSQLDLAEKEFERGKFVEAQKILEETPESFRDANWRFLRAHSSDFGAQILPPQGMQSALRLQFLPQGDCFVVRCIGGIGMFTPSGEQRGGWLEANGSLLGRFGIDRSGTRVAFAKTPGEIVVSDVTTRNVVRRWPYVIGDSGHVMLSLDGEILLAAGGKQLTAYAVETGAPLWVRPYHGVAPAFGPDGQMVAVLAAREGSELKVEILDSLTGAVGSRLETTANNSEKTTLQFNQSGDRLACLGGDEVILWDARTARKVRALHFPGETVMLLSPEGDAVATTSGTRIRLWDTATGRLLRSLNGASTEIFDLAFSPDGRMLLSAHKSSQNTIINVWPTRLAEAIASVRPGTSQARRVLFDREGSRFYAMADKSAGGWESRSGSQTWRFTTSMQDLRDMAISPSDGSIILTEFNRPKITHLSAAAMPLESFGSSVHSSLRFNRTGDLLLAVEGAFNQFWAGPRFLVMNYPSGSVLQTISFAGASPETDSHQPFAAFCLDDTAVATAAKGGGIAVWDWKAGILLRQISAAQTGTIACLASSPDGRHLVSGGPDRWIRVWDAATGRLEAAFRAHWEGVRCVKFGPDGREILSGSEDGTVRIHDTATGEERLAFYGLTTPVVDMDISADGKLIAAITTDGFTRMWDRQLSSVAALLPREAAATEPPAGSVSPVVKQPTAAHKHLTRDGDGWEDHLASFTPSEVEKSGHGWSLKDGELFSPNMRYATLPLIGDFAGTSYRVRVKLRQLPARNVFQIVLSVADRMCGFSLEARPDGRILTGLGSVNGKGVKEVPGAVEGKQIIDTKPHDLEVTVQLAGPSATITATLDKRPLYEWTGPTAALSQNPGWVTATKPGTLALGTFDAGWAVSEVKVKRLDQAKASP